MAQKTRFLDSVSVNAFGNVMPEAIITASGGIRDIVFTRANGVSFTLPLAASASSVDSLTTASVVDNTITFTKGDLSTFSITVDTGSAGASVSTGSLLATGSVAGNTLTFTKGDGTSFTLVVATGSAGGSGGIFKQTGSIQATTNDLQITGSVSTSATITGQNLFSRAAVRLGQGETYVTQLRPDGQTGDGTNGSLRIFNGGLRVDQNITASGNISASGNLFANLTENSTATFKTVVYDESTGKLFRTGSYGSSGGSGGGGIFKQTGSIQSTTNDLQITGSLTISGSSVKIIADNSYNAVHITGGLDISRDLIVGDDLKVKDETVLDKQAAIGYEGNENLFNGYTLSVSQSTDTGAVLVEGAVSISGSLTVTGSSPSINIGSPTDNSYSDGYFSTFTENTRLANALDDISEAFADIAPAKAGQLTSLTLTRANPSTVYSGYLAGGLITNDWYIGFAANQLVSNRLSISTAVSLTSPNPSTFFRAGKKSDFTPSNILKGGVTSSLTAQSDAVSLSTKALNTGEGVEGTLNITNLIVYNNLWVKANATISHTMADTGSYKYKLSADNDAGETAETQLFYLGSGADYPDPSIALGTITSGSTSYNDLSGIKYLKTANFTIPTTGNNLFNPVYNINQFVFSSTYFTNETTGSQASDTPQYGDILELGIVRSLTAGLSSGQSAPTGTVAVTKPGKTGTYNASYTLTPQLVNSYTSDPSTTINEPFLGESRRYTNLNNAGWTSANALTNGNLQVQNGRLVGGNTGDYSGFTGIQNFYRLFSGFVDGRTSGTFNLTATGFTSLNVWDSGNPGIEVALIIQEEVTGNTTASKIFDFGRAQQNGPATGNIYGIKIGTVGPLNGNWSLGTNSTIGASGNIILWVRFSSPDLTNILTNINLTVS